jgi:hypothetical protein
MYRCGSDPGDMVVQYAVCISLLLGNDVYIYCVVCTENETTKQQS